MNIRIRADSVEIDGYVNAIERKSTPLLSRMGRFVERICKGAFKRALERTDDVRLLLNHDPSKDLGGTKDGNLELYEDNIGLHARATITDPDVVKKARQGKLRGWSFGFRDRPDGVERRVDENGMPLRDVHDLDLEEVSLLDDTKIPAYEGTLVTVRSNEESIFIGDSIEDEIQIREETPEDVPEQQETVEKIINYDEVENLINEMKQF